MENENDLMDSLLKEHAKNKGVDEDFLIELELKLDTDERGNVIPIERGDDGSRLSDWKRGLALGVAACVALCLGGKMLWRMSDQNEELVLDVNSASRQIENAEESLQELEGSSNGALKKPLMADEVVMKDKLKGFDGSEELLTQRPKMQSSNEKQGSKSAKLKPSPSSIIASKAPRVVAEPALEYAAGEDFGDGWGGDIVSLLHEFHGLKLSDATYYIADCMRISYE